MGTVDYIVIAIVVVIVAAAGFYIWRQKKQGAKCIGCPYAKRCSSKGNCSGGCNCHE